MSAIAKLQFCNFVQIFVAAREIHSYEGKNSLTVYKNWDQVPDLS